DRGSGPEAGRRAPDLLARVQEEGPDLPEEAEAGPAQTRPQARPVMSAWAGLGLDGVLHRLLVELLGGCELVVLSACDTGLGGFQRGEGMLGLQRGFQSAGARATAVSLWSVHDAATSVLMEEFYARLWGKKGVSKLEALRQAQLALLRDPAKVTKRMAE